MYAKLFLIAIAASLTLQVNAQKVKQHGDLSFLEGTSELNVEFVYPENMVVGKMTEAEYIDKSVAEREEKVVGDGDRWLKGWKGARESMYHPKFMSLFNKTIGDAGAKVGTYPDAKYTMVVEIVRMEPGFHAHVMKKNSEIDAMIYFVETTSKENSLAHVSITRAPGRTAMGGDYSVESRLQESYAVTGKRLAALLKKKVY